MGSVEQGRLHGFCITGQVTWVLYSGAGYMGSV